MQSSGGVQIPTRRGMGTGMLFGTVECLEIGHRFMNRSFQVRDHLSQRLGMGHTGILDHRTGADRLCSVEDLNP